MRTSQSKGCVLDWRCFQDANGRIAGSNRRGASPRTSSSSAAASRACGRPPSWRARATSSSSPKPSRAKAIPATRRAASRRRSDRDDSPELHAADTIAAGDGLCDERAVQVLVEDGPRLRARADGLGRALRSRAPTERRRWRSKGRTARAACCTRATRPAARSAASSGSVRRRCPACTRHDHARAVELVIDEGRRCAGVRFLHEDGSTSVVEARASCCSRPAARDTSIATRPTRRSRPATASRWRIRAGARVADLEFVQFHPTALTRARAAAVPAVGSAARRRRAARQRGGEPFMAALRPGGRSGAARSCRARASCASRGGPAPRSICRWSISIRTSSTTGFR